MKLACLSKHIYQTYRFGQFHMSSELLKKLFYDCFKRLHKINNIFLAIYRMG